MNNFRADVITRIESAEQTLAPYVSDWERQRAEEGSESGESTPGIAEELCRTYCFEVTGFANWRQRAESDAWFFLAAEARNALHICDESDADSRQWVLHHVHALEQAASIAGMVTDEATA